MGSGTSSINLRFKTSAPTACDPQIPIVSRTIPLLPDASAAPDSERNAYVELEIFKVEPESEIISSFYLRRADGKPLAPWEPGQFLPIRVTIPGQPQPALRTYTLSTTPNPDHYLLSIQRGEGDALVSRFLHADGKPGLRIEAMTPRGKFVLTPGSERPVVFISGGVGVTPMIATATHIVEEGRRSGKFRRVCSSTAPIAVAFTPSATTSASLPASLRR